MRAAAIHHVRFAGVMLKAACRQVVGARNDVHNPRVARRSSAGIAGRWGGARAERLMLDAMGTEAAPSRGTFQAVFAAYTGACAVCYVEGVQTIFFCRQRLCWQCGKMKNAARGAMLRPAATVCGAARGAAMVRRNSDCHMVAQTRRASHRPHIPGWSPSAPRVEKAKVGAVARCGAGLRGAQVVKGSGVGQVSQIWQQVQQMLQSTTCVTTGALGVTGRQAFGSHLCAQGGHGQWRATAQA